MGGCGFAEGVSCVFGEGISCGFGEGISCGFGERVSCGFGEEVSCGIGEGSRFVWWTCSQSRGRRILYLFDIEHFIIKLFY